MTAGKRKVLCAIVLCPVAALVVYLAFAYLTSVSPRLAEQVQRGEGTVVEFSQLTSFTWDRVFIFEPYTPPDAIHTSLGFPWSGASRSSIVWNDGINLVVFVKGQSVVHWFEHPRNQGDLAPVASLGGYSPEEARFEVHIQGADRRAVLLRQTE